MIAKEISCLGNIGRGKVTLFLSDAIVRASSENAGMARSKLEDTRMKESMMFGCDVCDDRVAHHDCFVDTFGY
jgi:hypothetical protein